MHLGSLPQHTSIQRVSPWSQFPEPISYSLFTKCLSSSWITITIISDFLSPSLSTSVSVYLFNEFFISHPNITTLMSKNPCYYFIQEHQLLTAKSLFQHSLPAKCLQPEVQIASKGGGAGCVSFMRAYGQHLDIFKSSQENGDHSSCSPSTRTPSYVCQ